MYLFLPLMILLFLWSSTAHAWPATVISAHDGDTVTVAPFADTDTPLTVRLYGIDAPELAQEGGAESTNALHQLVGLIFINNRCINASMLEQGQAWYYARYCKAAFCKRWQRLQKEAVQKKRGLWHNSSPVAPWIWRRSAGHE